MAERQALVINLEEFRHRRKAESATSPTAAVTPPVLWLPVRVMVPLWSYR